MLVLDYDGVLLDSLSEVAAVSYLGGMRNWKTTQVQNLLPFKSLLEEEACFFNSFFKNRFHCQPAGDFLVLAEIILDKNLSSDIFIEKDIFKNALEFDSRTSKQRTSLFFKYRQEIINFNLEAWLSLHQIFSDIWNEAKKFQDNIILLTNKDKEATLLTSKHFGLDLKEENIYAGDSATKSENLVKIIERFKAEEISFIDDSIKNLSSLKAFAEKKKINFQPLLANWGYLGPSDQSIARENSISIISREDFNLKEVSNRVFLS